MADDALGMYVGISGGVLWDRFARAVKFELKYESFYKLML
jgi:hypothetical protein